MNGITLFESVALMGAGPRERDKGGLVDCLPGTPGFRTVRMGPFAMGRSVASTSWLIRKFVNRLF